MDKYFNLSNRINVFKGLIVLVVLAGVVVFVKGSNNSIQTVPLGPIPTLGINGSVEGIFDVKFPSDFEKIDFKDVGGGDASGVVARRYKNGKFEQTVLADLPNLGVGEVYQNWLVRGQIGDNNYNVISAGRLIAAKGGWLINFESNNDLTDHNKVLVTIEKIIDNTPEERILEASF